MTERSIALTLLGLFCFYLYQARLLPFGSLLMPSSGFMPILAGIGGLLCSLMLVNVKAPQRPAAHSTDWTKFIFILIGFIFYVIMMQLCGYLSATFIFLFYLFKLADKSGYLLPLMLSAGISGSFYILFKYYLSIALP